MSVQNRSESLHRLVAYSLLTALGIVFSRLLTLDAGALRLNFGAVPVLLAAIVYGPLAGAIVGGAADALGGLLAGYALNPFITLGAASIGWACGMLYRLLPLKSRRARIACGVVGGHLLGSICINSLVLHFFFGYAWPALAARLLSYPVLSVCEILILYALTASSALNDLMRRQHFDVQK